MARTSATKKNYGPRRRHVRFKPDAGTIAAIDTNVNAKKFSTALTCLVLNQSYTGVALLTLSLQELEVGQEVRVKVGGMAPMRAKVVWFEHLDAEVIKLGLDFSDSPRMG